MYKLVLFPPFTPYYASIRRPLEIFGQNDSYTCGMWGDAIFFLDYEDGVEELSTNWSESERNVLNHLTWKKKYRISRQYSIKKIFLNYVPDGRFK